ncbi:MAG: hypothetical protein M5R36_19665 [Deltaproteobacteria bacterium]|nr:hypothetical protein [Deltaproteobacteria bacterium]
MALQTDMERSFDPEALDGLTFLLEAETELALFGDPRKCDAPRSESADRFVLL